MGKTENKKISVTLTLVCTAPFLLSILLFILHLSFGKGSFLDIQPKDNSIVVSYIFICASLILVHFKLINYFKKENAHLLPRGYLGFIIIISNLLFTASLMIHANYLFRSSSTENTIIEVKSKYISQGRGTDYYIIIDTDFGKATLRVSKKNYSKFKKGETLRADVQEGLFSGYYLIEKLK